MSKLYICTGCPGSGKSTWAKQRVAGSNGVCKIVNKDLLRLMLDNNQYSPANEAVVCKLRDIMVEYLLKYGFDVISDDCNLNPAHVEALRGITRSMHGYETPYYVPVQIVDFTNVPIETCIERDANRPNPVGADVIRNMAEKWNVRPSMEGTTPV